MKTRILSILTRTPLHVGAGSSVGAIDLPVQRERHTQIPIIPGSSLKGVLRDLFASDKEQIRLFGADTDASEHASGDLVIGEARACSFPVRSARGSFAWITSPLALQRFAREKGVALQELNNSPKSDEACLAGSMVRFETEPAVVLEEYRFDAEPLPEGLLDLFRDFIPGDPLLQALPTRLVVVSDGIYSHFCANACEVQQRIRIKDGVVAPGALFNQENVPSETLFYAVIGERRGPNSLDVLAGKLEEVGNVVQIGGDETIGLGFCSVAFQGGAQ